MIAYSIDYEIKGKQYYFCSIDAKDINSAKRKIGRKHGYKTGRMVKLLRVNVVGYL